MAETKKPDWIAIEGEFRAGVEPLRAIASRHGVSEAYIRKRAKAAGWSRDPSGTKREIVKAVMAGAHRSAQESAQKSAQVALSEIEDAAALDIADMERGLRINRQCLINLETAAETSAEPREIKVIVEATSAAIESIRKIRGLDDPAAGNSPAPSLDDFYGEPTKP